MRMTTTQRRFDPWTFAVMSAFTLMLGMSPVVSADVMGSGAGFSIPDGNASGAMSMISFAQNETISDVSVLLDINHERIGNLTVSLTSPSGTMLELMHQPGEPAVLSGYPGNLSGAYSFSDSGGSLWAVALAAGDTNIATGTYRASGADTGGGTGVVHSLASTYSGLTTAGNWSLKVTDSVAFDSGSLNSWSLSIQSVPEPSAIGLAAFSLLGLFGLNRSFRRR